MSTESVEDIDAKKNNSLAPIILIEESKETTSSKYPPHKARLMNKTNSTMTNISSDSLHINIPSSSQPTKKKEHPPIWKVPIRRTSTLTKRKILGLELPKPMRKYVTEKRLEVEKEIKKQANNNNNKFGVEVGDSNPNTQREILRRPSIRQFCTEESPNIRKLICSTKLTHSLVDREEVKTEEEKANDKVERDKEMKTALVRIILDRSAETNFLKSISPNFSREYEEKTSRKLDNKEQTIRLFLDSVKKLTEKERYKRASTLFRDAVFSRNPRYLFSSNFTRKIYSFQGNPAWTGLLSYIAWIYMFMTLFETSHSSSRELDVWGTTFSILFCLEITILILFISNELMDFILKFTDIERGGCLTILMSKKYILHLIIDLCLILDVFIFYSTYTRDLQYFRFARLFRPFKLLFYSQNMRRWFKSILNTWTHVLDIVILFVLTILIFALLGIKVLGGEGIDDEKTVIIWRRSRRSYYFGYFAKWIYTSENKKHKEIKSLNPTCSGLFYDKYGLS